MQALAREGMNATDAGEAVRQLQRDCEAVIGECLEAVSGELSFFTLPTCFELFGFDLLVDQDWHVWLLEANAEPDFMQVWLMAHAVNMPRLHVTVMDQSTWNAAIGCYGTGCRPGSAYKV